MQRYNVHSVDQTGSSKITTLIWLLILAGIVYMGVKIVPVYIRNYQIQNLFEVNANRIQTTPLSDIKADISSKLTNMHAPITMDDVNITDNGSHGIIISAQYSVVVKIVDDWKITFNFNPKAETNVQ
ncbi:MAG: DUF4845 domain-containing protein [bacterium]